MRWAVCTGEGQGRSCKDMQSSVAGGMEHQEEEGDRKDNVLATLLQSPKCLAQKHILKFSKWDTIIKV